MNERSITLTGSEVRAVLLGIGSIGMDEGEHRARAIGAMADALLRDTPRVELAPEPITEDTPRDDPGVSTSECWCLWGSRPIPHPHDYRPGNGLCPSEPEGPRS